MANRSRLVILAIMLIAFCVSKVAHILAPDGSLDVPVILLVTVIACVLAFAFEPGLRDLRRR